MRFVAQCQPVTMRQAMGFGGRVAMSPLADNGRRGTPRNDDSLALFAIKLALFAMLVGHADVVFPVS